MKINSQTKTHLFLPLLVASTGLTLTPTIGFIPPTLAQRALDFATQGCRGLPQEAYFMTQNYHINVCRGQGGLFMVVSFRNEQLFDQFPVQAQGNSYVGTSQKASYQVNSTTFIIQPHNNPRPITERVLRMQGNPGNQTPQESKVTGTVTYRQRIALPPNATVIVRLQDVSRFNNAPRTITQQTNPLRGQQVPVPFSLIYNPNDIQPNGIYIIRAEIYIDGRLTWANMNQYRVITQGNPNTIEIIVQPVN